MKERNTIGLHDLVAGLLFSLRAEGKSNNTINTIDYYNYLLYPLILFADDQNWPDDARLLDSVRLRAFLTWTGTRIQELKVAKNGGKAVKKAKPSTAWPYYRALRRLFNWAVQEGYLHSNPVANIHFKPPPEPAVEGYTPS